VTAAAPGAPARGAAGPAAGSPPTKHPRHLLDLADWTTEQVHALFDTTDVMAQVMTRTIKKVPALQGFTVGHAVLRGLHAHPAQLRARRARAVRRRHLLRRRRQQRQQGRVAQGHAARRSTR
jgi:hypothetical protein